jgi:competence protein ComEA
MFKITLSAFAAVALVAGLSACTDRNSSNNYDNNPNNNTVSSDTTHLEPGTVGTSERDTGHADVKRDFVKHETVTESVPTVENKMVKADINRMGKDDFVALGMSKQNAENIVNYRDKNGNFKSVDDLRRVPGVDQAWLEKNRDKLSLSTG